MQRFYLAVIEKAKKGFGVFFPDLPGCASFGKTVEEAAINAYTAAQAHAALTQEHGEELPEPRAPEAIKRERGVTEAARLLVPVETDSEPVRVNISLPASALAALNRTAKELSLTRSGAIAHLALTGSAGTHRIPHAANVKQRKKAVSR